MGADSTIAITAGAGTLLETFLAAGGHQQYVRQSGGTATTLNQWTIVTTAVASQIAADANRVGMLMVNTGTGRVYLRFDNTLPTATVYGWYLDPMDRWEVPLTLVKLAVSVLGTVASGLLLTTLATDS
jgi:hypothetical protein